MRDSDTPRLAETCSVILDLGFCFVSGITFFTKLPFVVPIFSEDF